MIRRKHHRVSYFASSFATVFALILIWRGSWLLLDGIDKMFFGGSHVFSVGGGIIIGFLILYLPDRNLSEIRKL